ncbi:MAG: PHP domain-containing protein [Clostridiales bacterium]|nr:PHP domain-containing protein [Clostridiales bacterium]
MNPGFMYYDLHLHSCLSPCADEDMSPANICAMARLKGLDLIALTDHNTGGNLAACFEAAQRQGLLFVPGMELCSKEEVHLLAYFPDVKAALQMDAAIRPLLPRANNRPDTFGRQLLMDSGDRVLGEEDALLIGALDAGLDQLTGMVRSLGGAAVPAHIHRGYGLIQVLGFLPETPRFYAVEAAPGQQVPEGCLALHNSDAHQLGMIQERLHSLPAMDVPALIAALNGQDRAPAAG